MGKRTIRKILAFMLRFSGIPFILREYVQKNKVTIVCYHAVAKGLFDQHLAVLTKIYNVISLNDYIRAREDRSFKLPPKSLVITMDDGWKSNFELLDVLKKYDIKITVFLCSGIVDTHRHFWFKRNHPKYDVYQFRRLSTDERESILEASNMGVLKEEAIRMALNKNEIVNASSYISFQSHSRLHPFLPRCSQQRAQDEIIGSKSDLENKFGFQVNAIAYPNGDYSDRDIAIAKQGGYKVGLTVDRFYNTLDTEPFRLKRMSIEDSSDVNEAVVRASGLWVFIQRLIAKQKYGYFKVPECMS